MDTKNIVTAKAHANIALIKYWGKKDEKLKIPCNSSISFSLDAFYTLTSIQPSPKKDRDLFYLNDTLQDEAETQKIINLINIFRANLNEKVLIKSKNSMPTAAGLSSSSSGLAALIIAADAYYKTNKSKSELSYLARLGSGSASRSLYGPFAIWKTSDHDKKAIAYPLKCDLDLTMIILVLSSAKKDVLSRQGMKHCVETSSIFQQWVQQANQDAETMQKLMLDNDFVGMGELMEANTLLMHKTTEYANPPFTYLKPETYEAINYIYELRKQGHQVYFTMDAGPNVKLLCLSKDSQKIYKALLQKYQETQIIVSKGAKDYEIYQEDLL